jgi:hypothetical protein
VKQIFAGLTPADNVVRWLLVRHEIGLRTQ